MLLSGKNHGRVIRLTCLLALSGLPLAAGCGGESEEQARAGFEGPYIQVSGAQTREFDLTSGELSVLCKPKPGLQEFDFEASSQPGSEGGEFLRFTVGGYSGAGDYVMEYDPSGSPHKVEVGLSGEGPNDAGKSFKYRLFQELRLDNNTLYNSFCALHLEAEELATKTKYAGQIHCVMLWADFDSSDSKTGNLTHFVDVAARFECEY